VNDDSNRALILLVEDENDVREAFAMALEDDGHEVVALPTAEDGLKALKARDFDVVLSDYMLPGENGVWMLNEAVKLGRLRTDPLIITAHARPAEATGFKVLQKPLDLDVLLKEVRSRLQPSIPEGNLTVDFAIAAVEASRALSQAQREIVDRITIRAVEELGTLRLQSGLHQRSEHGLSITYRVDASQRRVVVLSIRPAAAP
jgi:DNA-binding NtrC family response regulator